MAYRWICTWNNGSSCWADWDECRGHSKVLWHKKSDAKKAAKNHENRYSHYGKVSVEKVDGRKFKKFKIK